MSNTENKNDQIKNIKEISGFVDKKVNPLIVNINETKSLISGALNKINSIKQAKIDSDIAASEPVKVEKKEVVAPTKKEAPAKVEPAVEVVEKVTQPIVESIPKYEDVVTKVETPEDSKPVGNTPPPKTYINPDINNMGRDGQRPSSNYKGNNYNSNYNNNNGQQRPYNNNAQGGQSRPYNNAAGSQGGQSKPYNNNGQARPYNNNAQGGQGGQSRPYNNNGQQRPYNNAAGGTRPPYTPGGAPRPYNNNGTGGQNRPYNNNGTGQRPFTPGAPRPFGAKSRDIVPAIPIVPKKDTTKKKVSDIKKDDNKKNFNKRDLIKRGYQVDDSLMNDGAPSRYVKVKKPKKEMNFTPQFVTIEHAVVTSEFIPIKVFSEKIGKTATEIIKKLFDMGKIATINDNIAFEDAEFVALDFGVTLELSLTATAEDKIAKILATSGENDENLVKRPPIVTIMGHVDHGKTSLLDYIRKTNVVQKEAGGITQHIGAYTIELNNEKITFLDTPGHEAFTAMRRRGAKVTDISIIVVAADDGIMPQTIEAINHSKEAGVSIIVAVNKIDKTDGNLDKIKQQLSNYDLLAEDWGGQTIICPVSAKVGTGVKDLLENVLLLAEMLELKANKKCNATGSIIEARLDKGLGPVATVLVQNGTLKVKDYIVAGTAIGKVRAMTDHLGKRLKEATPSTAVQIQGFADVPNAGDVFVVVADEKLAKQVAQERADKERSEMSSKSNARSLDDMFKNVDSKDVKTLALVIKADVQGSAEAIKQSMIKLSNELAEENVKIHVVHTGVGAINESDVLLADTTNAIIIGFNVRPDPKAKSLADRSNVDIRNYSIIYAAIDDITSALKGMFVTKYKENIIGHAEIRAVFKLSTNGTIAGSYILDGKVSRNAGVRLLRENVVVYDGKLASLRREKDDAKDVSAGYECGIGLEKFNDIKVGDIIECFIMEKLEQK